MEKLELTGSELMARLNWNKSKTYYWMKTGKFETIETPEGQKALLTEKDIEKYRKKEKSQTVHNSVEVFEDVQYSSNIPVQESLKNTQNDVIIEALNLIRETQVSQKDYIDRIINAEKQVKLLEDFENRKDNEINELRASFKQFESVKLENIKLKEEIDKLKKELAEKSNTKPRKFFGIRFK